jgi:hypothetical protein
MKREHQMKSRWPFLANASLLWAEALAAVRAEATRPGLNHALWRSSFERTLTQSVLGPSPRSRDSSLRSSSRERGELQCG